MEKELRKKNADDFLKYVGENTEVLKNNLRKNITYNEDYFEDVFNDTVIKVYNSILNNGTEIKDYKQYFFMASKFQYILTDNRYKRKRDLELRGLFDDDTFDMYEDKKDEEEREKQTTEALNEIREMLGSVFSPLKADIYLKYQMGKINKQKTSYQTIAEEYGLSVKEISTTITEIKKYLRNNPKEINQIKNRYYDNAHNI